MSRRRRAVKRIIPLDTKYNHVELAKFINRLMWNGKKTVAQSIVYQALERAEKEAHREPVGIFEQAIRNATPMLEVKSRRVGGATYPVPIEVRSERALSLAMSWIIKAARARKGKPMAERLAEEFLEASKAQGAAVKRKEEMHRMAEANRAFAHYRW